MKITRTISTRNCVGVVKEVETGELHEFRFNVPSTLKERSLKNYFFKNVDKLYDPAVEVEPKAAYFADEEIHTMKLSMDLEDFINYATIIE